MSLSWTWYRDLDTTNHIEEITSLEYYASTRRYLSFIEDHTEFSVSKYNMSHLISAIFLKTCELLSFDERDRHFWIQYACLQ